MSYLVRDIKGDFIQASDGDTVLAFSPDFMGTEYRFDASKMIWEDYTPKSLQVPGYHPRPDIQARA